MIRSFVFVAALWCVMPQAFAQPKGAAELAVDVVNRTTPVLCAEKDNVQLDFASPDVRAFRVQAKSTRSMIQAAPSLKTFRRSIPA